MRFKRWALTVFAPAEVAQPMVDYLWQRHNPGRHKRFVMTHASVFETEYESTRLIKLMIDHTARGTNGNDVHRKIWEVAEKVGGSGVLIRLYGKVIATILLDVADWDDLTLEDKQVEARSLADRLTKEDWRLLDETDPEAA